jgi:hypothetical protein
MDLTDEEYIHPLKIYNQVENYINYIPKTLLTIDQSVDFYRIKYNLNAIISRWIITWNIKNDLNSIDALSNKILHYWNDFITINGITMIALPFPHTPFDYAIYQISKHYNLKILLFYYYKDPTSLEGNYLCTTNPDWNEKLYLIDVLKDSYSNSNSKFLPENNLLEETTIKVYEYDKSPLISKIIDIFNRPVYYLYKVPLTLKKIYDIFIGDVKLKRHVLSLQTVELSEPYVYFPLHFQPEATTIPTANHYRDQLEILRIVRAKLDNSVNILIKEHPAYFFRKATIDFQNYSPMINVRSRSFYSEILAMDNVYLVSHKANTLDLIKKSKGIITASGSVVFEAMYLSKPVLTFGDYFYNSFPNVFKYSLDAIELFLNALEIPFNEDYSALVKQTLSYLRANSIKDMRNLSEKEFVSGDLKNSIYFIFDKFLENVENSRDEK